MRLPVSPHKAALLEPSKGMLPLEASTRMTPSTPGNVFANVSALMAASNLFLRNWDRMANIRGQAAGGAKAWTGMLSAVSGFPLTKRLTFVKINDPLIVRVMCSARGYTSLDFKLYNHMS